MAARTAGPADILVAALIAALKKIPPLSAASLLVEVLQAQSEETRRIYAESLRQRRLLPGHAVTNNDESYESAVFKLQQFSGAVIEKRETEKKLRRRKPDILEKIRKSYELELADPNRKLSSIAKEAGFNSANHLSVSRNRYKEAVPPPVGIG